MSPQPRISFIAPVFNHLAETKAMYESLLASMPAGMVYELIFVDDFSNDGCREWLTSLASATVQVVFNETNLGFARANHAGVVRARGEILALVNNDLIFESGWLEPMLALVDHPWLDAGLVGNLQYRVVDGSLDHAGVTVLPNAKLDHIRHLPDGKRKYAEVFAVTGACCMVRRDLFNALGGFDENFVNGGEDIDLCMRVRQAGKKIYVAHDSRVWHHVGATRGGTSLQCEKNSRLLQEKWRPVFKQAVIQALLETGRAGRTDKTGEPQMAAPGGHGDAGALQQHSLVPAYTLALLNAETALRREEARWRRLLDTPSSSAAVPGQELRVRCLGFGSDATGPGVTLGPMASLLVEGAQAMESFHLVGMRLPGWQDRSIHVEIHVNRSVVHNFQLSDQRRFDIAVFNPALVQSDIQCLTVHANIPDALRLSHVFVNGKMHVLTADIFMNEAALPDGALNG